MNPVSSLWSTRQQTLADASGSIYGVVVGIVTDNQDPEQLGRVKVKLPWLADEAESNWARVATLMAGNERGVFYLPEVDDEVLLAFEHGDLRAPFVVGALWNGKDKPPLTNANGENNQRLIKSRSGLTILLDDSAGAEKIEIADKEGKQKVVIDMAGKKIVITSGGDLDITAEQGAVAIKAKTINLEASADVKIKATGALNTEGQSVNIKGQPMVNIN